MEHFYSLLDGMLVHHRVTPPASSSPLLIYTPGWREALYIDRDARKTFTIVSVFEHNEFAILVAREKELLLRIDYPSLCKNHLAEYTKSAISDVQIKSNGSGFPLWTM